MPQTSTKPTANFWSLLVSSLEEIVRGPDPETLSLLVQSSLSSIRRTYRPEVLRFLGSPLPPSPPALSNQEKSFALPLSPAGIQEFLSLIFRRAAISSRDSNSAPAKSTRPC